MCELVKFDQIGKYVRFSSWHNLIEHLSEVNSLPEQQFTILFTRDLYAFLDKRPSVAILLKLRLFSLTY